MHLFSVPVTIRASITVAAHDINEAMSEARRFAEGAGEGAGDAFRDGWNDEQAKSGGAIIKAASSFDTEAVEAAEVDYCGTRWAVQPQRDWHADMPDADGTRIEPCDEAAATSWGLFERQDADTSELVEDYPTREQAEAARAALEAGQPLPDPIWPEPIGVDITAERLTLAGFTVEGGGAGASFMVRTINHPSTLHRSAVIIATDREGGDLPRADSWRLGIYRAADWGEGQPLATLESIPGAVIEASANAAAVMARALVFGAR